MPLSVRVAIVTTRTYSYTARPYIGARSPASSSSRFVLVHCTELCRFCHRRSSLFSASALFSSRLSLQPRLRLSLCSALFSSRLGSALICAAPPSLLCIRLFSALASPRLSLIARRIRLQPYEYIMFMCSHKCSLSFVISECEKVARGLVGKV